MNEDADIAKFSSAVMVNHGDYGECKFKQYTQIKHYGSPDNRRI